MAYRRRADKLAADRRYYRANKERFHLREIKKRYGVSEERWQRFGNTCAICGAKWKKGQQRFHVDHDHETDWVRGFLCYTCNNGLGCFKDNPDLLRKAIRYLTPFHRLKKAIRRRRGVAASTE